MSAGAIKGITIELGADASGITKALKESDSALKKTQAQLNDVNRALKFNPNNVTLLNQKAKLLEGNIKDTSASIKNMRNALAQMDAKGVSKTSKEYMTLEREIIKSESKLKHFNAELLKVKASASSIGQLGTKFTAVGNQLSTMGNQLRAVSAAASACAIAIAGLAVKSAQWADELNTLSKVYSVGTKELQMYAGASELVDVDTKTLLGSMQKMKKTMASASEGSKASAEAYKKLGVNVVDANGNLRDSNKVFAETLTALGKMTNETERDALAMKIFGKSAAQLNPLIEDGGKAYLQFTQALEKHGIEYVDQKTLDRANQFNDTLDTTKAVFQQGLMVAGTKLAASLAPAFEKLADKAMSLAGAISNMSPNMLKLVGAVGSVVGVLSPALLLFGGLSKAIGSSLGQVALLAQKVPMLTTGFTALKAVMVANPILAVVAALGALSAIVVKSGVDLDGLSEKVSSAVQNFAQKAAEIIPKVIEGISNAMPDIINAAVEIIIGLVTGLIKALPTLVANAPKIVKSLAKAIIASIPALVTAGKQLIQGLWKGAGAMVSWVVEKFKGLGKQILKGIKNALGIHSPSREFALVGQYSMMGLAEGITENLGLVDKAMNMVGSAMTGSYAINSAPLQTVPSSVGGSVVFNGNYSFMNDRQIDHFMKSAERMMRRRATV